MTEILLDETTVSEIASRPAFSNTRFEERVLLTRAERDGLCATVRQLRENPLLVWKQHPNRDHSGRECTECHFDNRFHAYDCFFHNPSLKISEEAFNALHDEKTSLQSQLEQLRAENERLTIAVNELTRDTRETEQCVECQQDGFRADMFRCADCEQWFHRPCLREKHVEAEIREVKLRLAQVEQDRDCWRTRAAEAEKAAEKWYHERY